MEVSAGGQGPQRELIDRLAEEFAERHRRGEGPSISEYVRRHPDLAADIRELFPALILMEDLGPQAGSEPAGTPSGKLGSDGLPLRQLGDYHILREVGRGGMGVVYEAEQISLGRHVALKVLPGRLLADEGRLERFQREARVAARLHHTNIVPVFGVGEHDGVPYYAMQFIRGQGLDQVIRELRAERAERSSPGSAASSSASDLVMGAQTPTPTPPRPRSRSLLQGHDAPDDAAAPPSRRSSELSTRIDSRHHYFRSAAHIGLQAAEALAYAHAEHVLHRDIKPSNLLLEARGNIWVTDFGLALADDTDPLTHSGDLLGTVAYMAPERLEGRSDARSDVYSLGLTLYELLTLRPAFADTSRPRLIKKVAEENPPAPRKVDPRIPRDLETIVLKSIQKEPGKRYQSAAALAEDLRCFLAGRPIQARRASATERFWLWCQRDPSAALLSGTVAFLLVTIAVGASIAAWMLREERNLAIVHLREAYLAQARASRLSGRAGRRFEGLEAIARAAAGGKIAPAQRLELRNEAIASMALTDLRVEKKWKTGELVAFDASFTLHAQAEPGGDVIVRRAADQTEAFRLDGLGTTPVILRFSPGGGYLAAKCHTDITVHLRVWDLDTRAAIITVPIGYHSGAPEFSADDGRLLAMDEDGSIRSFDLARAREEWRLAAGRFGAFSAHPTGKWIAVAGEGAGVLDVLEAGSGRVAASLSLAARAYALSWHPAGRFLAAGCENAHVYLWDMSADRPPLDLQGHWAQVVHVGFIPPGDVLLSVSWDGTFRLWETASGLPLAVREGSGLQAAADGTRLAARLNSREVAVAEVARGLGFRTAPLDGPAQAPFDAEFDAGGALLLTASGDGVCLWDAATPGTLSFQPLPELRAARFHPAGGHVFTVSAAGLQRWAVNRAAGKLIEPAETLAGRGSSRTPELAVSPDGLTVAFVAAPAEVAVLAAGPEPSRVLLSGHGNVGPIAFSPDSRRLATGTWQGAGVKVWDAATGAVERDLEAGKSAHVAFSPDGAWLATGAVEGFMLWDTRTWEARPVEGNDSSWARCAAFAPDARVLAIAGARSAVRLIDPATGGELAILETPLASVLSWFRWSPDGTRLIAGSGGRWLEVWDLREVRAALAQLDLDWEPPRGTQERARERAPRAAVDRAGPPGDVPPSTRGEASLRPPASVRDVLIPEGASWRFLRGRSEPSAGIEWTGPDFDDSGWEQGPSGFGHGDLDDATVLDDMKGSYTTVYVRGAFPVDDPGRFERLVISLRVDDGCVVHVNGVEVGRIAAGERGARLAADAVATFEASEPLAPVAIWFEARLLGPGRNVIAIQGLNRSLDSSDFSLIPVLLAERRR